MSHCVLSPLEAPATKALNGGAGVVILPGELLNLFEGGNKKNLTLIYEGLLLDMVLLLVITQR